ncbi:protein DBF4 homolog A isoform X3 [Podarcis muralis]
MKPSGLKSSSKGQLPCDMQGRTERSKPPLKNVKKDSTKSDKLKCKPLTGKVFYLDIPSNVLSEKIAKDLKELGGRVEGFLSKDISYLISNKKEAKFAQTLGQISPVPSPDSVYNGGNSSPHPSSRRDRHEGSSFKLVDTVRMSRGKSLVEKAIKEQELIPSGSILSNALSWGVKILHVDDIKKYIDQKKKDISLIKKSSTEIKCAEKESVDQKTKNKLKNPFLKVEDRRRRYRPFYLQLSSFPVVNYSNPKPYSPFETERKNIIAHKQIENKQRRKCSVGQFAPLIGTKTEELKERLKRQDSSLRWYSRKSITTQALNEGSQHLEMYPKSAHKNSTSESSCSVYSYHTICSSEASRKVSGNTESGKMPKASNLSEISLSTNLVHLPPQKESKQCMKNLPEIYEHYEPISRQNLQGLSTNLNSLHARIPGSEFSERQNISKPKRKLNHTVLLPAKCLKKVDTRSAIDLRVESSCFPRELTVLLEPEKPLISPPSNKEPNELTDINIQSSPIKLSRKAMHSIGRNKNGNQKQKMELCLHQADELPVPEETKNVQSSSTQALLQLFQTSEANSDFGGFSSIQENKDSNLMKDTWEDQHTDALWSLFSTSASSSPFIGF